ncbi:MAG: hypothetical protein NW201_00415 [Gemmatimonadales bacterium]|nr:hypothetical protein [Gemmatimonadales bacterium]
MIIGALALLTPLTGVSARPPVRSSAHAASTRAAPADFVLEALAAHRVVFLGDIHPLAEPKRIVSEVLRRQDPARPLRLLALEVAHEQQEHIDAYLASDPEDIGILVQHARTLRSHWGASEEYLDIYRTVWRWNHTAGARPIRILAADIPGWPIAPLSEMMAAGGTANRDEWMAKSLLKALPRGAEDGVLIFMGGYHGLKQGGAEVTVGRARARFDFWMAGHLREAGLTVFSILADAPQGAGPAATRVYDLLAARHPGETFAAALDEDTDAVRQPLVDVEQDGYRLEFLPARFALRQAADAMIVLGAGTPLTPIRIR